MSTFTPPASVYEWRRKMDELVPKSMNPRHLWDPLEESFASKGYLLWRNHPVPYIFGVLPPNSNKRAPDGFSFRTKFDDLNEDWKVNQFMMRKTIHCPARTLKNEDVLIRLVTVDGDEDSHRHLDVIHRLAMGEVAARGDNHVLPVLDFLNFSGMSFAVFPLMTSSIYVPWFCDFYEVFDYVQQVLQGIHFCHDHLVAHLDIDDDNILINFAEGPLSDGVHEPSEERVQFRSLFPVRYYLIDFEYAVAFDKDSNPASRTVRGLPTSVIRTHDPDISKYGRTPAKEMLNGEPYCPFRADIFQVGTMFKRMFEDALLDQDLNQDLEPFRQLINEMTSDVPSERPSALTALERVRSFMRFLSSETLMKWPLERGFQACQE